jgi:hypothetical protein
MRIQFVPHKGHVTSPQQKSTGWCWEPYEIHSVHRMQSFTALAGGTDLLKGWRENKCFFWEAKLTEIRVNCTPGGGIKGDFVYA